MRYYHMFKLIAFQYAFDLEELSVGRFRMNSRFVYSKQQINSVKIRQLHLPMYIPFQ